jgi:membrane protein implicated in regulation of membrane protease activity
MRSMLHALAVIAAALALPAAASGSRADDDEVRVRGTCSPGRVAELRVRADDGKLRVELRVDSRRRGETWTVLLLHERRIAARVKVATRSGGSLRVRRLLPDLFGTDTVVARATGPGGATCRVSARL